MDNDDPFSFLSLMMQSDVLFGGLPSTLLHLTDVFNLKILPVRLTNINLERSAKELKHHLGTNLCQRGIIPPLAEFVSDEGIYT